MNNPDPVLKVTDLKTWFHTDGGIVRAVDGISFEVRRGETFALLGESGCGKSMTALSLMRLIPEPAGRIVSGEIRLNGQDLCGLPEVAMRPLRGQRLSMIFQEPMTSLNPVMTVGAQIAETLRHDFSFDGKTAKKRACDLLALVGIPDPVRRYDEYPHQMSGGMKQRIMIAMALAGEPEVLIADEPTTALDVTIQAQILDLLRRLQRERGMAILLITHDLAVVAEMADRVAVMYAGQIVETADRAAFFGNPRHPYSQKLFHSLPNRNKRGEDLGVIRGSVPPLNREFAGCRFANRCDAAWEACETIVPRWIEEAGGVRCHLYDPSIAGTRPTGAAVSLTAGGNGKTPVQTNGALLQVTDLKVHFPIQKGLLKKKVGQVKAVDGVSLSLAAGRTIALVGESGCGKTTAGKAILQLIRPTGGTVRFGDIELTTLSGPALREKRGDCQIIFQDPYASLNPRMMVGDIIKEGIEAQRRAKSSSEAEARIDRLLEQVGLPAEAKQRYPHEFSGGQRQRICIARALAVDPKVIICDEPTSALDVSVQAQILNLLKDLQERLGLAYLFITHNLSVVEYFAHEVAVMYLGRIVEYGPVEAVLNNPRHPYTQALLSAVPQIDAEKKRTILRLEGEIPSPVHPPKGCHFHPRCPEVMAVCRETDPEEIERGAGHTVRCHLYQK
ncbi:MAG: ABC transporter ATP-binding protein [Candidatus Manganitrophaceae bacterium]|nr:MAG: ABC transporter ATP-binding protein [Candidatus Manganitrophaceae bacterium]